MYSAKAAGRDRHAVAGRHRRPRVEAAGQRVDLPARAPISSPSSARSAPAPPATDSTEFRVWAPHAREVAVRVRGADHPLADEGLGVRAGTRPRRPRRRLPARRRRHPWPDPCSRWQPVRACAAPSRVFDPGAVAWTDEGFTPPATARCCRSTSCTSGRSREAGTFDAAIEHLPALAELGFTVVEVMPVAEFPGERGWGYDGAYLWSAQSSYGGPEGFARFVDAAHAAGLAVILDLVPEPRRRLRRAGARGVRRVLHRPLRHVLGPRDQLRRRGQRRHPGVARAGRRGVGHRPAPRRLPPRRDPRRLRHVGAARPRAVRRLASARRGRARSSSPRAG